MDGRIYKFLAYLSDTFSYNWSVPEMANAVDLSPTHFSVVFKKALGISPAAYLLELRLLNAQVILETTHLRIKHIGFVFCLMAALSGMTLAQEAPPTSSEKHDAEKAWEALIKAKGGREKLHAINNILAESKDKTSLDVMPRLHWVFQYKTNGEPTVGICNIAPNKYDCYGAFQNGVIDIKHEDFTSFRFFYRVAYLLETKWDRPVPMKVSRVVQGRKALDVIQTLYLQRRVDFFYEPETQLVSRVDLYDEKGAPSTAFLLSDYTKINGIQMPRTWGFLSDYKQSTYATSKSEKITFTFNVDYDPNLFSRPLRVGSRNDWKARVKTK